VSALGSGRIERGVLADDVHCWHGRMGETVDAGQGSVPLSNGRDGVFSQQRLELSFSEVEHEHPIGKPGGENSLASSSVHVREIESMGHARLHFTLLELDVPWEIVVHQKVDGQRAGLLSIQMKEKQSTRSQCHQYTSLTYSIRNTVVQLA
jgi:hypothetical protein